MDERDLQRLRDIVAHGLEALEYVEGVSLDAYLANRRLRLITERLLEIIGEAARATSEDTRRRIDVDWRGVTGLRNVVAHRYGAVDHRAIYVVVTRALPTLVARVRAALDHES